MDQIQPQPMPLAICEIPTPTPPLVVDPWNGVLIDGLQVLINLVGVLGFFFGAAFIAMYVYKNLK